jgi:hypothetical protein
VAGGGCAVVRIARQQVCAVGEPDRAASRIGSVGKAANRGEHSKKVEGTLDCAETARWDASGLECGVCSGYASLTWWSGQQTRARSAGSNRGADVGSTRIGAEKRRLWKTCGGAADHCQDRKTQDLGESERVGEWERGKPGQDVDGRRRCTDRFRRLR